MLGVHMPRLAFLKVAECGTNLQNAIPVEASFRVLVSQWAVPWDRIPRLVRLFSLRGQTHATLGPLGSSSSLMGSQCDRAPKSLVGWWGAFHSALQLVLPA